MGKSKYLKDTMIAGIFFALCLCSGSLFGQNTEKTDSISTIPAGVLQLLKPSCMACHSNEGRDKPRSAVNFSVWEKYTPTEKMMLTASIIKEVKKGSMPPKGFLKSHPEAVLSEVQIKQIVQWCDSLKAKS